MSKSEFIEFNGTIVRISSIIYINIERVSDNWIIKTKLTDGTSLDDWGIPTVSEVDAIFAKIREQLL
jgi:hypothetical protein